MVQVVVKAAHLLVQVVQLVGLVIGLGRGREVALFLLLELRSQLEDFLVLLVLGLVADAQLSFCILDAFPHETALIIRPGNLIADALQLEVLLPQLLLGVHDVTIRRVHLLSKLRILTLEILKFGLEHLLVACLLLDLLLEVLAQVTNAVLE